jgi:hypothetical protein
MSEPERDLLVNEQAEAAARSLGQLVVGRDLTDDEFASMSAIFRAAVHALREGFITRLAEHVKEERESENVEEFFENINPN